MRTKERQALLDKCYNAYKLYTRDPSAANRTAWRRAQSAVTRDNKNQESQKNENHINT